MDYKAFYKRQISLTEWFNQINSPKLESIRQEDNGQKKRLHQLHTLIQLPIDESHFFSAREVAQHSPSVQAYIHSRGDRLCAIRLTPIEPTLPKLRLRGITAPKAMEWFHEQAIDPEKYQVEFGAHSENMTWSTIFVANPHGIFGEIIRGMPLKLTQGLYAEGEKPTLFAFDYETLRLSEEDDEARKEIQLILKCIHVPSSEKQKEVEKEMHVPFHQNYLQGYFETADCPEDGMTFVDYNHLLGTMYKDYRLELSATQTRAKEDQLKGISAFPGKHIGKARIVHEITPATRLEEGEILICPMTTPDYIPLMQQASAIITELGGILSHAAIIARELKKPCIVGVQKATQVFSEGEEIEIDAEKGIAWKTSPAPKP